MRAEIAHLCDGGTYPDEFYKMVTVKSAMLNEEPGLLRMIENRRHVY